MNQSERYVIEQILQNLNPLPECAGGEPKKQETDTVDTFIHFMDGMPGGFLIYYAKEGEQIIYANQGLVRMFGCDSIEEFRALTGNSFRGIVYPEDLEAVEESIKTQIADSQYDLDYVEYRIQCKNGSIRWIEDYGHYLEPAHVGGIFYAFLGDATQKHEQQLAAELAKANLAVNSKNTFLSNISHDMRTPLHAIFGFTSLAKMNLSNPAEAKNYLNRVEAAGRQLLDMINKVLDASTLADASGVEETECSLKEIIQKIYDFLLPQAQEKSLDFRLDCSALRHTTVYADRDKLSQLILSLTNNAVTYTNPGGQVLISVTEGETLPNNYAVYHLIVQDTGIGISPDFLEEVFEPFSREKNTTLSGIHGIGLGLTIAKSITDLMGGQITAQSKVGEGSTFTASFTFRFHPTANMQKPHAARNAVLHILLAEDNEINREIEVELLELLGFSIDPVENGKLALDALTGAAPGTYDLILMDLQMPVMNGWEASSAIRALPDPSLAGIPIIALSANMLPDDQLRSKKSGINAHLFKPMDLPLLLDTIEQLTGKRPMQKKAE